MAACCLVVYRHAGVNEEGSQIYCADDDFG